MEKWATDKKKTVKTATSLFWCLKQLMIELNELITYHTLKNDTIPDRAEINTQLAQNINFVV